MTGRAARRSNRSRLVYALLVWLYPAAHRRRFGDQMRQMFADQYRDVVERRGGNRLRFWLSVLADAGTSLVVEHGAAVGAHGRRAGARLRRLVVVRRPKTTRRYRARPRPRVPRRLHYRRSAYRPARVPVTTRRYRLVYRGRLPALALVVALAATALVAGAAVGRPGIAAVVAGLAIAAWLAYRIRLIRALPAGPGGDGPAPPGGACVREPRRPLPVSPAGAAARPRHEEEPPARGATLG